MQRRKFLTVAAGAAGGILAAGMSSAATLGPLFRNGKVGVPSLHAGDCLEVAAPRRARLTLLEDAPLSRYQPERQRLLRFRADSALEPGIHDLCDARGNAIELYLEPAHAAEREWVAVVNTASA